MSHDEAWKRTIVRLRADLGEDVFASWFARLELDSLEDGLASISTPTRFLKGWIETHYVGRILAALNSEFGGVVRVQFVVRSMARPAVAAPSDRRTAETLVLTERFSARSSAMVVGSDLVPYALAARPGIITEDHAASGSPLDRRFTFNSFLVGRSNQLAYSVGRRVAGGSEEQDPIDRPVYIHASAGLGKTHLLQAIAQSALSEGRSVVYLTAERFMRNFVGALQARNLAAFQNGLRGADLLVFDNVQLLQGPPLQREFGETLNFLVAAGRQVVVAADRPPEELENLDECARKTFSNGLCVAMGPLDEPLRLRILEARVAAARRSHPSFALSSAVLQLVVKAIDANGRDLEAAVGRLLAHTKLTGMQPTVETAQSTIHDLLHAHSPRRITVEDIQNLVASHYSMTRADLLSSQKTAKVVKPRQVAMYLAKALTLRSLPEIGRRFGGRDHTTVLHAVRKIETLARGDCALTEEIELLKRALMRIGTVSSSFMNSSAATKNESQLAEQRSARL